ncbi:MAG: hypothetical protein IPI44_17450 [Sulfuritalea sp.]|nr:hypothetical protein [Sulfuritalea sp.]
MPVISIGLSPGFQRSVVIDSSVPGEVNRLTSVIVDAAGKGVNVCRGLQRLGIEAFCLAQGGSNADELMSLARRGRAGSSADTFIRPPAHLYFDRGNLGPLDDG